MHARESGMDTAIVFTAVAVPVRGAGCMPQYHLRNGEPPEVAVPVRGAGCMRYFKEVTPLSEGGCSPREGRGLHVA